MTLDTNYTLLSNIFRKLEVDIVKLAWSSFTTNTLFDDLFIDDLSSHSAINNSLSLYQYDISNHTIYKPPSSDLLVVTTNQWMATQNNPTSSYCLLEIYPPYGGYTINTDLKVYVSMDNGAHFEQFTNLYQLFAFQSLNIVYLKGEISGLTPWNNNQMILKIQAFNSKDIILSAFALGVRY